MPGPKLVVAQTPELLAIRAAEAFETSRAACVRDRGRFTVALSGGKTPRTMLSALASRSIDWIKVHLFWSDERCVPPDDPNSNFRMVREALLSRATIPGENVHRMKGELEPKAGAAEYETLLKSFFRGEPVFDLIFLGLGPDGHTASLFPGTKALTVTDGYCVANRVESDATSPWRLTLTYPAINAARQVIFLVEGAEKAAILCDVLDGPREPLRLPAQAVAPRSGDVRWFVDSAAASRLGA
jgi:6-phosphogluconolactonase